METEPRASIGEAAEVPPVAAEPTPNLQPPAAITPGEPGEPVTTRHAHGVERLRPPHGAARNFDPLLGPAPSGIFLFFVTFIAFVSDISSKLWAEKRLANNQILVVLPDHLQFILAKNRGGAWGLLQKYDENVRRPFFLLVSLAAIVFIITLYRRLQPNQRALKWGLPLVLGGALGNVFDRIRYGHVIDFIDYRSAWIEKSYKFLEGFKYTSGQYITDHWPTFNVADVAICVGVGLMAVDMFTSKRGRRVPRLSALPLHILPLPTETSATAPSEADAADPKTQLVPLPDATAHDDATSEDAAKTASSS